MTSKHTSRFDALREDWTPRPVRQTSTTRSRGKRSNGVKPHVIQFDSIQDFPALVNTRDIENSFMDFRTATAVVEPPEPEGPPPGWIVLNACDLRSLSIPVNPVVIEDFENEPISLWEPRFPDTDDDDSSSDSDDDEETRTRKIVRYCKRIEKEDLIYKIGRMNYLRIYHPERFISDDEDSDADDSV